MEKQNKKFWEELIAYFRWYDTDRIEYDAPNNSSVVACFRCRGNVFTEPLPSNEREIDWRHTAWWEGFMKHAVEMGSDAMIYVHTKFNKERLRHSSVKWGEPDTHTQTARQSHKPPTYPTYLIFSHFPILKKQSRLMRSRCCPCVCMCVFVCVCASAPIVARQRLG
jgi:hypothetical protein